MYKTLVLISILFSSILIVTNFAAGTGLTHIIIGWANPGMLALVAVGMGFALGFGVKGYLSEKGGNDYNDDEGINF